MGKDRQDEKKARKGCSQTLQQPSNGIEELKVDGEGLESILSAFVDYMMGNGPAPIQAENQKLRKKQIFEKGWTFEIF